MTTEIARQLDGTDTRWAKAMAHPVRAHALRILSDGVASPSDIAQQVGLPVANVSYHVNILLRLGCIEPVQERHVRGAIEHLYRAVRRPVIWSDEWDTIPVSLRNELVSTWLRATVHDFRTGVGNQVFADDRHPHFTRTPLLLDETGFEELSAELDALLKRAHEIQDEAGDRLADGAGGGAQVDTRLIMAHFGRETSTD